MKKKSKKKKSKRFKIWFNEESGIDINLDWSELYWVIIIGLFFKAQNFIVSWVILLFACNHNVPRCGIVIAFAFIKNSILRIMSKSYKAIKWHSSCQLHTSTVKIIVPWMPLVFEFIWLVGLSRKGNFFFFFNNYY